MTRVFTNFVSPVLYSFPTAAIFLSRIIAFTCHNYYQNSVERNGLSVIIEQLRISRVHTERFHVCDHIYVNQLFNGLHSTVSMVSLFPQNTGLYLLIQLFNNSPVVSFIHFYNFSEHQFFPSNTIFPVRILTKRIRLIFNKTMQGTCQESSSVIDSVFDFIGAKLQSPYLNIND